MPKRTVFICGGGTGGHFFSGVALAEKILDFCPDRKIIFVGTSRGIEARFEPTDSRMSKAFIHARGLKGKSVVHQALGVFSMLRGIFDSFFLLVRERPELVVGVGGYASAPTVFAAFLLRPLLCHRVAVLDQNSSVGLANRLFSRLPGIKALCAFTVPGFHRVSLPVRAAIERAAENARAFSWPPQTVLVMGGSQGARGLNRKWVSEILSPLRRAFPNLKFIHQTGEADFYDVKKAYVEAGIEAEVFTFSSAMQTVYDRADLVVCRSGAMTVFEIIAFFRPCVFIPFPNATDDHQYKNAIAVQKTNWVLREENLNWASFEPLLRSSSPSIPSQSSSISTRAEWKEILRPLLKFPL